jgi:hypothetical protein
MIDEEVIVISIGILISIILFELKKHMKMDFSINDAEI